MLIHWKRRSVGKSAMTSTQRKKKSSVSSKSLMKKKVTWTFSYRMAKEELSEEWKYEVYYLKKEESFVDSYELKISSVKVEKEFNFPSNK